VVAANVGDTQSAKLEFSKGGLPNRFLNCLGAWLSRR